MARKWSTYSPESNKNRIGSGSFFKRGPTSFQMARVGSHRCWTKSQGPTSGLRQRGLQQITTPGQPADKAAKKLTRSTTSFIPSTKFQGNSCVSRHSVSSFIELGIGMSRIGSRRLRTRQRKPKSSLSHGNGIAFV